MNIGLNNSKEIENLQAGRSSFMKDVLNGLSQKPKYLHSKYFYDEKGDKLFQQIMAMPTYYLTDCELDIFSKKTAALASSIMAENNDFDLIELGAGDALKSTYLLKYLVDRNIDFSYIPVDISENILSELKMKLSAKIPSLKINALQGDYFEMLDQAMAMSKKRKIVLFLGGNIGNMSADESNQFCKQLQQKLNKGDLLLIGFDLKKNPHTVLNAYNDKEGITAAFNLNLLERINRELAGNFKIDKFQHYQTYDPISGACKSYLVSLADQTVEIGSETVSFKENELIDMEISQKYSQTAINNLATASGFKIVNQIADSKNWFVDSVWQVV